LRSGMNLSDHLSVEKLGNLKKGYRLASRTAKKEMLCRRKRGVFRGRGKRGLQELTQEKKETRMAASRDKRQARVKRKMIHIGMA